MFLLTVFSMFLLFGFLHLPPLQEVNIDTKNAKAAAVEFQKQIDDIDKEIAAAQADPARADEVPGLKLARSALVATRDNMVPVVAKPGSQTMFDVISAATKSGELKVEVGDEALNAKATQALSNPEFVFYKMKQKGYKLSFLLVPLSLPWMILLFAWKKNVKVYDHVVFLLYSISFMSMLAMVAVAMASAGVTNETLYGLMFTLIPAAHIFAQLKEGYALGWFSAAWRTFALSNLAVLTLALYFSGILVLGLLD